MHPHERLLLGPGPSPVSQRVLRALGAPTLGHLDPQYLQIMDQVCAQLRQVFRTANPLTFPVSGTGMAGILAGKFFEKRVNVITLDDNLSVHWEGDLEVRLAELLNVLF